MKIARAEERVQSIDYVSLWLIYVDTEKTVTIIVKAEIFVLYTEKKNLL